MEISCNASKLTTGTVYAKSVIGQKRQAELASAWDGFPILKWLSRADKGAGASGKLNAHDAKLGLRLPSDPAARPETTSTGLQYIILRTITSSFVDMIVWRIFFSFFMIFSCQVFNMYGIVMYVQYIQCSKAGLDSTYSIARNTKQYVFSWAVFPFSRAGILRKCYIF